MEGPSSAHELPKVKKVGAYLGAPVWPVWSADSQRKWRRLKTGSGVALEDLIALRAKEWPDGLRARNFSGARKKFFQGTGNLAPRHMKKTRQELGNPRYFFALAE